MQLNDDQTQEQMILSFLAEGGDEFTSGVALSDKLGLSRTAVWKHVEQLRKLGYVIEAIPSRGYRLTEVPDRLTWLELAPLLVTRDIGATVHAFDRVESTNAAAFKLAQDGALHGEVVIAEEQTQGRGRRGRSWFSPKAKNLYCSVILRPNLPPSRASELTLLTAVAVVEALMDAGIEAEIKWPNDVLSGGKKIAGILTELSADVERVHFAIVGIGVNLNAELDDFPEEVRENATSVRQMRGQVVSRALFTAALWARLERWLERHAIEGFAPVRHAWSEHAVTLGQSVMVKSEAQELVGTAESIDESGALQVRSADGVLHRILAGDVEQIRSKKS